MDVVLGLVSVVLGLISEAVGRATKSYAQSLQNYSIRLQNASQPSTPFINLFHIKTQIMLLIASNSVYLLVTIVLFTYMQTQSKGYKLRWLLLIYDGINIILAGYISISILNFKISKGGGMLLCNPVSSEKEAMEIVPVFALFFAQKILEYLDTWFFILRKSAKQVTFLHLFHHISITIVVGSILPFDYNGDFYLPILLNSFNQLAVYLHYLLATLGIQSPWASYLTFMQLFQFLIIFCQSFLAYRIGPTCGSPDFAKLLMVIYMGSMVTLFMRYLIQKYIFRRPDASIELRGVMKTPPLESSLLAKTVQHCGTARLNDHGECHIALPDSFPDPHDQNNPRTGRKRFTFVYHITPLNQAMPNLFVSAEVHNWVPHLGGANDGTASSLAACSGSTTNTTISSSSIGGAKVLHHSENNLLKNSLSSGGAIAKSKSFSSLSSSLKHNDRIIDGPLPSLFESNLKKLSSSSNSSNVRDVSSSSNERVSNASSAKKVASSVLCFSIAGGSSKGRVSWMVMTVPGEDQEDDRTTVGGDDWRAIN